MRRDREGCRQWGRVSGWLGMECKRISLGGLCSVNFWWIRLYEFPVVGDDLVLWFEL